MRGLSVADPALVMVDRGTLLLLAMLALGLVSPAVRGQLAHTVGAEVNLPPRIELPKATVPRVKALALDSALIKGWRLVDSSRDYAIFETPLDEPASAGPADARRSEKTVLRIRADFLETADGVTAQLSAKEIWRAGTERSWSTDITRTYRVHLERALASLNTQWRQFVEDDAGSSPPQPSRQQPKPAAINAGNLTTPLDPDAISSRARETAPFASSVASPKTSVVIRPEARVGVWAFEAERLARRQGCNLDEVGAVLVSSKASAELHRVGCINRADMRVRCNPERCMMAR